MQNKISLTHSQKSQLESFTNSKLYVQGAFGSDNETVTELAKQGLENAKQYLQRHKLGQRLNIMEENSLYRAVIALQESLSLLVIPRRIECYDISHLSGTSAYGSMVVCIDGRMIKKFYKLFKVKDQNNDYQNHAELMARRLQKFIDYPDKIEWHLPDLMIIDGGKGQLTSDYNVLVNFNFQNKVEMVSLAKREEEVFLINKSKIPNDALLGSEGGIKLKGDSLFLVQRVRDEAHRFAISANKKARLKQASKSKIEELTGVGQKTRDKILITFGSVKGLLEAVENNFGSVIEVLGKKKATDIRNQLLK